MRPRVFRCKPFLCCAVLTALALALLLSGCGSSVERGQITDVNDLEGRRVGVNLAWESDYLLTGRRDLELYRYDSLADMLMALNSGKLDAISIDDNSIKVVLSQIDGVEVLEPALGVSGYVAYFSPGEEALLEEFNAFVAQWHSSAEYEDYVCREDAFDGLTFPEAELPPEGTGRVIRAAYNLDGFPRTFLDTLTDEPSGFDIEVVKRWAAARDYRLELVGTSYDDMGQETLTGRYQLCVGYISSFYNDDARTSGILVSDSFAETPIHLCQKSGETINMDDYDFD